MAEVMIAAEGVHKAFPHAKGVRSVLHPAQTGYTSVLRGIDLEVNQGDYLALLGANGVGKTTLLKAMATLLYPDSGELNILGVGVRNNGDVVRRNVGYVLADERSFHWRLTGSENLEFFGKLDAMEPSQRSARAKLLLERLDLASAKDRPFGEYSTGMKQRLAVARALLKRPRVLLMDEPTRSIDPAHAAEVWRLVREEVEEVAGCLVLVTHQIQEALSLCSRVAILADGQIALDTTAQQMERFAGDLDGFSISVRGLSGAGLIQLRSVPGVCDVRVASQVAGEQVLEVSTSSGDLPLGGFIEELTGLGATVCSLRRATPLQAVVQRLLTGTPQEAGVS